MPDDFTPANPYRLLVSTRNAHKLAEIRSILGSAFDICDLTTLPDMPEIEETGETFEENAALKAIAASQRFDGWVIADDSGLVVDALDGAPGVRSARYAGEKSTDAENNAFLLKNICGVRGKNRSAHFCCTIVIARYGEKLAVFRGIVEGTILHKPRGHTGFGYDPLFVPRGYCKTFSQLGDTVKNTLSHRSKALEALRAWQGWLKKNVDSTTSTT